MTNIRHTGIYVQDIAKEAEFYIKTFGMSVICEKNIESNELLNDLFKVDDVEIFTTKLITELGCKLGSGEMLELIEVSFPCNHKQADNSQIYNMGIAHVAIGVDDIEEICSKIVLNDGTMKTNIHLMDNGKKCAFATDLEGNWIELIQNT